MIFPTATYFGQGVYFAVQSSYSAQDKYTPPDTDGYKYMFRVRAVVGRFTKGDQSMRVPPPIDPNDTDSDSYDSLADKDTNPGIYVIFHDDQAYPEYLIKFKS